jgi:hypothetical protein
LTDGFLSFFLPFFFVFFFFFSSLSLSPTHTRIANTQEATDNTWQATKLIQCAVEIYNSLSRQRKMMEGVAHLLYDKRFFTFLCIQTEQEFYVHKIPLMYVCTSGHMDIAWLYIPLLNDFFSSFHKRLCLPSTAKVTSLNVRMLGVYYEVKLYVRPDFLVERHTPLFDSEQGHPMSLWKNNPKCSPNLFVSKLLHKLKHGT